MPGPPKPRRLLPRLALGFGVPVAAWWLAPLATPVPPALLEPLAAPSLLMDCHGRPMRHALDAASATRRAAVADNIPRVLADCVVAAEDRRFYSHDGFDFPATLRAVGQALVHGHSLSGASTITQQFVKLRLHRSQPRTLGLKIREIFLARALERKLDKASLLNAYLEEADFGDLNRGVRQAAADYFGKPLADLSLGESAALAGLPQAPTRLNPRRHPDRLLAKRGVVLERLRNASPALAYPAEAIAAARAEALGIRPSGSVFLAPHFARMMEGGTDRALRTTLDLDIQAFAEARLRHHVGRLRERNVHQGAVVVLDTRTAAIRALVGSMDFSGPAGQVNHAATRRSPGSTLKPFTYLLAFGHGYGPCSLLADVPSAFPSPAGPYRPDNYDKQFRGPVTARAALANSLNVPAVRLLADCGGPAALAEMLRRCGFAPLAKPAASYGLGLTLGNAEVSLLDLAAAYTTIARGGTRLPVRTLEDAPPAPATAAADPDACWLVADILRDNTARSGTFGLDSPLRFPFPVAAKTGTSTDFKDNWTVGFTDSYTVAVWVGNSDNSPMRDVSGVDGAAPVFRDIMLHLHRDNIPSAPPVPPGVVDVRIDPLTGHRVAPGAPRSAMDWSPAGRLPPRAAAGDYAADGKVLLPGAFQAWFASPHNRQPGLFAMADGGSGKPQDIVILFPLPGTVVTLDPSLPDSGCRLTLETNRDPAGGLVWSSPTLAIGRSADGHAQAILQAGKHALAVADPVSGQRHDTWIEVRER